MPVSVFTTNLRERLAQAELSLDELVSRSRLDPRTVKALVRGEGQRPHARTVQRLAAALGATTLELLLPTMLSDQACFDRDSNPAVMEALAEHPELFGDWTADDFAELFSRFGHGGALSPEGALAAAQAMNSKRALLDKTALLLESAEADLLASLIETLFQRVSNLPVAAPPVSVVGR